MFFGNAPAGRNGSPVSLAASAILHVLGLLVVWQMQFPAEIARTRYSATPLFLPASEPAVPAPAPPPPARRITAPLRAYVAEAPRLPVPRPAMVPAPPAPVASRPATIELPAVASSSPPAPRAAPVQVGSFDGAPSRTAAPTSKAPVVAAGFAASVAPSQPVKTPALPVAAGFGDGGAAAASGLRRGTAVAAGFGDGSSPSHAARGAVKSSGLAGFGDSGAAVSHSTRRGAITEAASAFGSATASSAPAAVRAVPATAAPATPIEVLHKPRPVYTEEGRKAKVEGEVVLEVLFTASGAVRVERVVSGLGYGLDESAIRAADGIRFRPALRNGSPVDVVATVRIAFQLAY